MTLIWMQPVDLELVLLIESESRYEWMWHDASLKIWSSFINWILLFFRRWMILSAGESFRVIADWRARSLESIGFLSPPLVGKSRIWPTLDLTMKSLPRYLLIVLAFAGDSTMTKDLPILSLNCALFYVASRSLADKFDLLRLESIHNKRHTSKA